MQVALAVFGVFHHFELARELERHGHEIRIFSTYPWSRLRREAFPRPQVASFPYFHLAEIAANRFLPALPGVGAQFGVWNSLAFDRFTERRIGSPDAFIAISGAGLRTGRLVQQRGGIFVCDRGSTHQAAQEQAVQSEFARWGISAPASDPRDTAREIEIYAAADAITVPSSAACKSFIEMGISESKVHVIPYGVRLEKFYPDGEPAAGGFDVLFAGSVGLRKGIPYLLEAFARLRHPDKRLRIVGHRSPEIDGLIAGLPTNGVEFLPAVSQAELRGLMSRSHLLVLPSIEEGLALVQAEALACGCPVLCTEATGGEQILTDGVEGFIVAVRDVEALRDRMQRLADSAELQRTMRGAALERVRHLGGWATYGDRWNTLLQRLTGKR